MTKIIPVNRIIGAILDLIVVLFSALFSVVLLMQGNYNENLGVFLGCIIAMPTLGLAYYLLNTPSTIIHPILLNLIAVSAFVIGLIYGSNIEIAGVLFFAGLFLFFVILISYNNKFTTVSDCGHYSRENQVHLKREAYRIDKTTEFTSEELGTNRKHQF